MDSKICKSWGLFRLKTRNHRADIAIKRVSGCRVEVLSIRGSGPNPTNSRTLGTPLKAPEKLTVNGYFGLSFSKPNQIQWRRILHPCRRKRSYQSLGNEKTSLSAESSFHISKMQPNVNGAEARPAANLFLTLGDAAKMIGCCRRFLEKRIADGEIKAFKPSKRIVRIRVGELERFIECYSSGGQGRL